MGEDFLSLAEAPEFDALIDQIRVVESAANHRG